MVPLAVRADTMFGPRGVALGPSGGLVAVCDTGHHRLLLWRAVPERDGAPADLVIGQPDFASEGANGKGAPGPASLHMPTGVAVEGDLLVVADAWNHRVLIWHGLPARSNAPADVVLGQADFSAAAANRGRPAPAADTLNWCYGVALVDGRLVVADTGNRRVLIWNRVPVANGCPADVVLGQPDFHSRDENAAGAHGPLAMRWPHAAAGALVGGGDGAGSSGGAKAGPHRGAEPASGGAGDSGRRRGANGGLGPGEGARGGLQVVDAGNSRVLVWRRWPIASGALPDLVLGQADFDSFEHNRGRVWPDAATLNMPYGMAAAGGHLIVADTGNSRLLAWRAAAPGARPQPARDAGTGGIAGELGAAVGGNGAAAHALAGQPDFAARGENRWGPATRDSLCWPYGLAVRDAVLAVADSGNNRVSLWQLTEPPPTGT